MSRRIALALAGALILLAGNGHAEVIAISGGTVHTLSDRGTIDDAVVIIEDGQITQVGRGLKIPESATRIDATGKVVTPGLFAAHTQLGLVEVNAVSGTVDGQQRGTEFGAAFEVADAYNPASTLVAVSRVEGVTRAAIVPSPGYDWNGTPGGVLSGQAAVVHLGEGDDFLVLRKAAVVAHLGADGGVLAGGSRAGALLALTTAFEDAIDYARFRDAYDAGARREYSVSRADLEALQSVLSGDTPVYLSVDRASDIRVAIDMADRFGLKLVVVGGAEAWKVADRLAASNTAVIVSPLRNLPGSFDSLSSTLENARALQEAGVRLVLSDGDTHNARNLTQLAGNAVAHGLPWIEGLRAITATPADVLGLGDKFGRIAPGMVADVVVWDGDPLELTSYPVEVLIDGAVVEGDSRQTLLRDRYRDLTDARPPAYRNR